MSQNKQFVFLEIPVVESIYNFIHVIHPEPLSYSIKDEIGLGVFAVAKLSLRKQRALKPYVRRKYKFLDKLVVNGLHHSIQLKLSNLTLFSRGNKGLPHYAIRSINKYLYEKMMQQLSKDISEIQKKGTSYNEAIRQVMDYYCLSEDDIKYETLKKRNYRQRIADAPSTSFI